MAREHVLVVDDSAEVREVIRDLILEPGGYPMLEASDGPDGLRMALEANPDLVILDEQMPGMSGVQFLQELRQRDVRLPVIMMTCHGSEELAVQVFRLGAWDYVIKPFEPAEMAQAIKRVLGEAHLRYERGRLIAQLEETNEQLQQQMQELNTLYNIGRSVTSVLALETVLARVVEAATFLTQAEDGLLLLLEPATGDLVLRAAKNIDRKKARRLCIRVQDSLAGQVMESGEPLVLVNRQVKVATGYLVRSLIYTPLRAPDRGVIGILGVTNRESDQPFTIQDVRFLSALADYAAVAVENARLYEQAGTERHRLEVVLRETEEAIVVFDPELYILICNPAAGAALGISTDVVGQEALEVISHPILRELLLAVTEGEPTLRAEVSVRSGRAYNARLTPVKEVGHVLVMQDITRHRELDRVKSEFVTTISHDVRTPLTTIQGYMSLLERAGPLNDQQREFAAGVRRSIIHITGLLNDFLELGRIEAGYELEMEPLHLERLVEAVVEEFQPLTKDKKLELRWKRRQLPLVRGSPRRLRQVVENLIGNAIKYTQEGGWIAVEAVEDDGHVVVRVADNGAGIPLEDQPHIFERFYRAQTEEAERVEGSGLGLAIVKSVVEKHGGRVWMESQPNEGSVFTFILHTVE